MILGGLRPLWANMSGLSGGHSSGNGDADQGWCEADALRQQTRRVLKAGEMGKPKLILSKAEWLDADATRVQSALSFEDEMKIDGKEYLDLVFKVADIPNVVRALTHLKRPHFVKPLDVGDEALAAVYVQTSNIRDLEILKEVTEFVRK